MVVAAVVATAAVITAVAALVDILATVVLVVLDHITAAVAVFGLTMLVPLELVVVVVVGVAHLA